MSPPFVPERHLIRRFRETETDKVAMADYFVETDARGASVHGWVRRGGTGGGGMRGDELTGVMLTVVCIYMCIWIWNR